MDSDQEIALRRLNAVASHLAPVVSEPICSETAKTEEPDFEHGGDLVGQALKIFGVRFVFTLSGGHIAPILVGCKKQGIRVVDVRHEVNAVFAADAVSRCSDSLGVAVLTAGPGLTNTITAVKNAQMAGSPLLILGGATATLLKGRGSLQDIDQASLFKPHVKWQGTVKGVRDIVPLLEVAVFNARSGVPGPVFLEFPLDTIYPESVIRDQFEQQLGQPSGLVSRLTNWYIRRHMNSVFERNGTKSPKYLPEVYPRASRSEIQRAYSYLSKAKRPVFVLGSQVVAVPGVSQKIADSVSLLGIPSYLSGMARGLLGRKSPLHFRHKRGIALKEADLVVLAGVPFDFRLGYGQGVPKSTTVVSINRGREDLTKNRTPTFAIEADPGDFLIQLANFAESTVRPDLTDWYRTLRMREEQRDQEITSQSEPKCVGNSNFLNSLHLLSKLEESMDPNRAVMVADGGDFVATASYIVRPRGPLTWLDPGPFGTLGVGAGFALGVKLVQPESEVWLLWGDGSSGYSIMEYDTFVRHNIPVISLIGNDACWTQIYRDQVQVFRDDVACMLERNDYHKVADALGGVGIVIDGKSDLEDAFSQARQIASGPSPKPVLINAHIGRGNFREGSVSI